VKILIADDDRVSRRLLEGTLTRLGHDVSSVGTGTEATSALLAPDAPRLAILDWMMPGADGLAVCRTVRVQAPHYVYVILLTARDRPEDMEAAAAAETDDFLTKPFDVRELRGRLRAGERILELQERLLETQDALRYEATHDRLSELWNRGMILDHLERELRRARREGQPLAVALADLDHFKQVNDNLGHSAGDEVLRQTAQRMRRAIRDIDAIGRYGGEEFLVVLPHCAVSDACRVAERVRTAVGGQPVEIGDDRVQASVSLGVAGATETSTPTTLVQAADEALYRAKSAGRNRVEQ
jgi:diguanylate cyclase (GGDEF)-like protein